MECEQNIQVFPENDEQQVDVINEDGEQQVSIANECLELVCPTQYSQLKGLPQINGVELIGNKISSEIHVQHEMDRITEQGIDNIIYN